MVEKALTISREFAEIESKGDNGWEDLHSELNLAEQAVSYTTETATAMFNRTKNRYVDIIPSDEHRVILKSANGTADDYINASVCRIESEKARLRLQHIFAQAPLSKTCGDFWEMVWQENCSAIVMLTCLVEQGRQKCDKYFPDVGDADLNFTTNSGAKLNVAMLLRKDYPHFTMRIFSLTCNKTSEDAMTTEQREIQHYQYCGWPDHGVPTDTNAFLKFFLFLFDKNVLSTANLETVIHCSAGIGRSGVLALVNSCFLAMTEGNDVTMEMVKDLVLQMRTCRRGAIQTAEQLRFAVAAVCKLDELAKAGKLQSFRIVANQQPPQSLTVCFGNVINLPEKIISGSSVTGEIDELHKLINAMREDASLETGPSSF